MVVETVETLEFPPLAGNRAGVSQLSSAEEFPNWLAFEQQVTVIKKYGPHSFYVRHVDKHKKKTTDRGIYDK